MLKGYQGKTIFNFQGSNMTMYPLMLTKVRSMDRTYIILFISVHLVVMLSKLTLSTA